MEREPGSEQWESLQAVELVLVEPQPGHDFMIGFDSEDEVQIGVYNRAIEAVAKEHRLNPFHQVGFGDEVGEHAWEMLVQDASREGLERLTPEIQARAATEFVDWQRFGLIERGSDGRWRKVDLGGLKIR